jgi:hypothetical protein
VSYVNELIDRICSDNPKIKRDQLKGIIQLKGKYDLTHWETIKTLLFSLPVIKTTLVERMLEVAYNHLYFENDDDLNTQEKIPSSSLTRDLEEYMKGIKHAYKN